jgi:hypothetical protein
VNQVKKDPEVTYTELLALNQECTEAGSGYSEFQVASKFVHLLHTADDHAYIHLLTELARTGENSVIRDLWFIAQITWNQLKSIAARPPPSSHHLGMSASTQQGRGQRPKRRGPCDWCGAPGHDMDRCYSKDPENLKKFPASNWINGVPPNYISKKYSKEMY